MTQSTRSNYFSEFSRRINEFPLSEAQKLKLVQMLIRFREEKANIMITGATGSGKSSTINALFETSVARVGCKSNPETINISCYDLDGLMLWDTPGLGDSKEADARHAGIIVDKLNEKERDNRLIDAVLVILDAGSRDLGTSYTLINDVIIPHIQDTGRIIIAINQADMAMKGRHWNKETNKPEPTLAQYLEELAETVRRRVRHSTGVDIIPICYCAGYKEDGSAQMAPYNLDKLLCSLLEKLPATKRMNLSGTINGESIRSSTSDGQENYKIKARGLYRESGREIGEALGSTFGPIGKAVGGKLGELAGALIDSFCSWF